MINTQKTQLPKQYWLYSKKRYVLRGVELPQLPFVYLEHERILKSNGIPYRKATRETVFSSEPQEVYEYWNPNCNLKEEDLSLPLFVQIGYGWTYKYCERNYSHKVPTADTIEAAKETEKFVKKEVESYEQILREVSHYRFAKEQLSGEILKVCLSTNTPYQLVYDIDMNHERFKIFRVDRLFLTDWAIIFDLNKIAPNSNLTLEVPKHIAGVVIGRGGANIKFLVKELGIKRFQVIPK